MEAFARNSFSVDKLNFTSKPTNLIYLWLLVLVYTGTGTYRYEFGYKVDKMIEKPGTPGK